MSEETRKAEAKGDSTAPVEFRGHTFTVSRDYDDYTVDLLESLEEGKTVGIVRGALGPKQWRTVRGMNLKARDLYRRGSGLTLRRLFVLIKALPADAPLWVEVERARVKALKPTPEQIRERAAYYERKAKEATGE